MAKDRLSGKLAVILHADVAGSTALVQQDEQLAHERIQDTFGRLGNLITRYHGRVQELRGDALLAEFERVSDAVTAALAFQSEQFEYNKQLNDPIEPKVRVGIAMGEVIIADNTITGTGVVLTQRLEQISEPGGVVIQGAAYETIPGRFPFEYEDLGEHEVKGFEKAVKVYAASLQSHTNIPQPDHLDKRNRKSVFAFVAVILIVAEIALLWFKPWEVREEQASIDRMAFQLPEKPSIAVLPFTNMSADAEQEYFVDGMTEDLITDLSKLSELFVVARNTVFTYKGKAVKVHEVAEELGVRYVLEGSVRRSGDQVRINAQLIDALSGGHLWAERYDGRLDDVFALQDKVTRGIVKELKINLSIEDNVAISREDTTNLVAYDLFLRGWEHYQSRDPSKYASAIDFFERAIDKDPDFSRADAALVAVYWDIIKKGWWQQSLGMEYYSVTELARVALRRAKQNPVALTHQIAAEWSASFSRRARLAIEEAELALKLNPNHPASHMAMASAVLKDGRPKEAGEFIRGAMRLNPGFPPAYLVMLAQVQFQLGNYSDAADSLERAVAQDPNDSWAYIYLAATYGKLDQGHRAQKALARADALRADAGFGPITEVATASWGFKLFNWRGKRSTLKEGLRVAGAPKGGEWYSRITQHDGKFEIKGATTVDAYEAKALLDRGAIFIDMEYGWLARRIPGAYFLEWGGGEGWLFNEVSLGSIADKTQEIVIYTSLGGEFGRYGASASAFAVSRGFENVFFFQTGIDGWKQAGYPVDTGKVE